MRRRIPLIQHVLKRALAAIVSAMSRRVPPHAYFVVSAVFHYLGPAFAVLLFARVDVLGVAWLRIAAAALIFALWRRPWRALRATDREGRRLLLAWGSVLALMNCCFYVAIDRLPLGTVAAIEFLPVIALAAAGARSRRNGARAGCWPWRASTCSPTSSSQGEPLGVALAFANAGPLRRSTSCSRTGWPATATSAASTAWPPRC